MIRKANLNDLNRIMLFIHENWAKNHVLSKSKELINWQHSSKKKKLNFIISEDENNNIDGIFGFIPLSQFDDKLNYGHFWGAIWKSINKSIPSHGWQLIRFFLKEHSVKFLGLIGINSISKNIYKKLKIPMGQLKHFYFPNEKIKKPSIGLFELKKRYSNVQKNLLWKTKFIDKRIVRFKKQEIQPYKSEEYYRNRYVEHPFYEYEFISISNSEKEIIIIGRKQKVGRATCFNIVDISGDMEALKSQNIGANINNFLIKNKFEYMDILYYGPFKDILLDIGFKEKKENEIIPVYFEPYEKRNKNISFAVIGLKNFENLNVFKGDGDQDRPNVLTEHYS